MYAVASVDILIIGDDFLCHYSLLVDMMNSRLFGTVTQLHVQGIMSEVESHRPLFFLYNILVHKQMVYIQMNLRMLQHSNVKCNIQMFILP